MLDDVRVLDVTQVVSGSFASMTLADMGAEVIKVERPDGGDVGRTNPPFVGDVSAYFASVNRNKRAVALDLDDDRGREAFLDLAETADVVVENFRPGTMASFGLDYESVAARNDSLIYCSITGFGQDGPYAAHPALDIVVQAMAGNMSITGPPAAKPHRSGIPVADIAGSSYAVQSILGALYARRETGEGRYLDVSMLDGLLSWLTVRAGYSFATGEPYPRLGNELEAFVPYGVFETADAHLALVVVRDHHWEKLCGALDRPELASDGRFADVAGRRDHRERLRELLEEALARKPTAEWFGVMSDAGVPAGPVYDTAEVWDDEHVRSRDLLDRIEVDGQQFPAIDYPVDVSEADAGVSRGVPGLGEDSRELLAAAGYPADAIDALIEEGVVGAPASERSNGAGGTDASDGPDA